MYIRSFIGSEDTLVSQPENSIKQIPIFETKL